MKCSCHAAAAAARPCLQLERTIQRIWVDVLGVERISTTADFFETGGTSLKAGK